MAEEQPQIIMSGERADLLDKIQPSKIVDEVFHRLLGERQINGVWIKNENLSSRALTEKGAWDIATLMLTVSSQNVSLSKLKDHEIRARTLNIVKTAQFMCLRNWKEYGIKGSDQLRFVNELIMSNTLITLKQSQEEGIRNLLKNIGSADFSPVAEESGGVVRSLFRPR